jgi:hypothetical protein
MLLQGASSWAEGVRRLALPLAVVIAAGHMAKGLAKFVSWAGFLPVAWKQPDGVSTSLAMAVKTMKQPASLLSLQAVSLIGMALILAALWFSLRELRLTKNGPVLACRGHSRHRRNRDLRLCDLRLRFLAVRKLNICSE